MNLILTRQTVYSITEVPLSSFVLYGIFITITTFEHYFNCDKYFISRFAYPKTEVVKKAIIVFWV